MFFIPISPIGGWPLLLCSLWPHLAIDQDRERSLVTVDLLYAGPPLIAEINIPFISKALLCYGFKTNELASGGGLMICIWAAIRNAICKSKSIRQLIRSILSVINNETSVASIGRSLTCSLQVDRADGRGGGGGGGRPNRFVLPSSLTRWESRAVSCQSYSTGRPLRTREKSALSLSLPFDVFTCVELIGVRFPIVHHDVQIILELTSFNQQNKVQLKIVCLFFHDKSRRVSST